MADFTAVIRRAVEGLPDNTPELRARVYEKARSAVVRQMENMNPRPPEALIKRQIDKIDAAIAEVEAEFAEALPEDEAVEEPPFVAPDLPGTDNPEAYDAPESEDETPAEPVAAPYEEPAADDDREEEDEPEPLSWQQSPEPEPPHHEEPVEDTEPEEAYEDEPEAPAYRYGDTAPYGGFHGATFEPVDRIEDEEPEPDYSFEAPDEPLDDSAGVVLSDDDEDEDDELDRHTGQSDWAFAAASPAESAFEPAPPPPRRPVPEKDWAHVDSLLGLEPEEPGSGFDEFENEGEEAAHQDPGDGRRRRIVMAVVGVVVLLVVAVGGYLGWSNRDTLMALVSPADEPAAVQTTPPETATSGQDGSTSSDQAAAPAQGETAGIEKQFTQRLLPDGNEVEEGLPAAGTETGPARTVASQTTASSEAPPAAGQNAADPAPPVGAAQKMYVYEEQLGQSVPSAFQGTVEWELKQEKNGTDVPEPVIEGTMSVPEAGIAGTVTFRRNDDPSLPASHLVDIAFTLSDNFAGGAVENVQRISMKSTEAARGDPLIAVSAKITDDLYMLALNDFDQARAQNLALLGDRNWIDIPITYRNGRRALLTLEKGTTGMAIFDRAIQEWQALGDIGDSGNTGN
ncbi:hypothetical protein [Martelella endophytica]|uniref:hypothetical protein n=1 Tax=Martelella endophytica TaxID=1486262 RepID=UPI000A4AA62D|nr:hypothetical protein [Martelella endophytica]